MGQPQLKVLGWSLVGLGLYTLAHKWSTETLRVDCHLGLLPSPQATTPPDAQLSTITTGQFLMYLLHFHRNPPQCVTHMVISVTRAIPLEAQPGLKHLTGATHLPTH